MLSCTGFSFGGMLACCVAANIWNKSYINTDALEKSVVCITFGQPLLSIPLVQEVVKKFPRFEATIHSIFDKEDIIPRLLRYFSVGCMHYRGSGTKMMKLPRPSSASPPVPPNSKQSTKPAKSSDGSNMVRVMYLRIANGIYHIRSCP